MLNWDCGRRGAAGAKVMSDREGRQEYRERTYRGAVPVRPGWVSFSVRYRQSDLWILADRDVRTRAERALLEARAQVEGYAEAHPGFLTSHVPLPEDPLAPPLVRWMLDSGLAAGVGPMAAVAGAIAQHVGQDLVQACGSVVVENGGDLYLCAAQELTVGLHAGPSPVSRRLALRVHREEMPAGVATSSASVGHSISYGAADAACVVADQSPLSDAVATALGNRIRGPMDLKPALAWALGIAGVRGALVVLGKHVAAAGRVELIAQPG